MKKHLVKRETNADRISDYIRETFESTNKINQNRAKKIVRQMEDPIQKLMKVIKE